MMEKTIEIDARGKKCPRPIIELAKARRAAVEGSTIRIVADDLAFENDVRAWCETTNTTLNDFSRDGKMMTAIIFLDETT